MNKTPTTTEKAEAQTAENRVQFTPGPWIARDTFGSRGVFLIEGDAASGSGLHIAEMCELVPEKWDEQTANARLIAAAPDFYSESRRAMTRHDAAAKRANFSGCGCDYCNALRPILAKAEDRA